MAMATVVLTTALCANIPRFLPLQDMGIRFRIGPEHFAGILAAVLPMCLFAAALQAAIATLARSFKEAQSYMGVLMLLPMLPGMMSAVYTLGEAPWMYGVPGAGTARAADRRDGRTVAGARGRSWWPALISAVCCSDADVPDDEAVPQRADHLREMSQKSEVRSQPEVRSQKSRFCSSRRDD